MKKGAVFTAPCFLKQTHDKCAHHTQETQDDTAHQNQADNLLCVHKCIPRFAKIRIYQDFTTDIRKMQPLSFFLRETGRTIII